MKLIIELNDADLKRAIDEQVSKLIADMTGESIKAQVNRILAVKFERVNQDNVQASIDEAASRAVLAVTSRGYDNSIIRAALATAAEKLLKGGK